MAKWQLRRAKKVGSVRVNVSKRGLSASVGPRGAKLSANTKGEVHRTVGVPGTGLFKRERLRGGGESGPAAEVGADVQMEVIDGTGGSRQLFDNDDDVETLDVVGISQHLGDVAAVASRAGLTSDKPQAIRDCLLVSRGDQVAVYLLVTPNDNPGLFSRKETQEGTPKAAEIGRLGAKSARKLAELSGGTDVKAVVYIDARPMRDVIEARVRLSAFADDDTDDLPPPPPA